MPEPKPKHFETIRTTREDYRDCMRTGNPFKHFRWMLEQRGLIHSPRLGIESWDDPEQDGVRYFRNFRPQTQAEIAKGEKGIGRIKEI